MKTRNLILCAFFAAITAVLSQIIIPIPLLVPINLATLSVLLAGGLLGAAGGAVSQAVYVLMGALGVPVFANFHGGFQTIAGPTGGYIIGYILCAWLTGLLLRRLPQTIVFHMLAMVIGTLALYTLGTAWFMYLQNVALLPALGMCVIPFLAGDAFKIVLAAFLVKKIGKLTK